MKQKTAPSSQQRLYNHTIYRMKINYKWFHTTTTESNSLKDRILIKTIEHKQVQILIMLIKQKSK